MAVAELGPVVLDCPDPRALARFYAGVLGGTVEGEGDWVDLKLPGGQALAFQAAPGSCRRSGPRPTTRSSSTSTSK
ncbi:VOC family protein [Streptomyces violaceorubidus]